MKPYCGQTGQASVSAVFVSFMLAALLTTPSYAQTPGYNAIGVYRQTFGFSNWIVDSKRLHAYDPEDAVYVFGLNGDKPILGDWQGTGRLQMGIFRAGVWFIDWNDNHFWDSQDITFSWGLEGDIPVVGDWTHTGKLQIGVVRNVGGLLYWYVNTSPECGSSNPQGCDYAYTVNHWGAQYVGVFQYGWGSVGPPAPPEQRRPSDVPVIGNWNGPGVLGVGVYRPTDGNWYINRNSNTCAATAVLACNDFWANYGTVPPYWWPAGWDDYAYFAPFGPSNGIPVTGCWLGSCPRVNMGFFNGGTWDVDITGNHYVGAVYSYGLPGDIPVVGPWNSITVNPSSLSPGQVNSAYSATLTATGGSGSYTWLVTPYNSSIPPGLALYSNGVLSGNPTAAGTYIFTVQVVDVVTNLTAAQQYALTINLSAPGPSLSALVVNPSTLSSGQSATVTITLSGPAPAGGASIALTTSNSTAFPLPSSYVILAGQASGTFGVVAGTVNSSASVTLSGAYNSSVRTTSVTVNPLPPMIVSLTVNPSTLTPSQSATVTITLSGAAPQGGAAVSLTSSNAAFPVPASYTIPSGQSAASFQVTAGTVSDTTTVMVTATYNNSSQNATVTVAVGPQGTCPANRDTDPKWAWSTVEYVYESSFPDSAMFAAAAAWSSIQGQIVLTPSVYFRDIRIQDDNSIRPDEGQTLIYSQLQGGCASMKDYCGRCMNADVILKVEIKVNHDQIFLHALGTGLSTAEAAQSVISHELGHALGADDVPDTNPLCSVVQKTVMYQNAQALMQCRVLTPRAPCDSNAVYMQYSTSPGSWCDCSGIPCNW